MVAFVSGNGVGLFNSSLGLLGGQGSFGQANLGRAGEQAYVNIANGNLILRRQDEHLAGQGADIDVVRTYNSQAQLNDDNGDNWRLGLYRQLHDLTGILNSAGSTIWRTDGDGTELSYTYDTARGLYINRDGGGSADTLACNGGTWTWTDGDSRVKETYDWIGGSGKLLSLADADGNALTCSYTGTLLTLVTDASGEETHLDYSGINLISLRTIDSSGATLTRVRYGYDGSNRLTSVTLDLTPEDNSVVDGRVYTTTYTYDGVSKRVASITQTDGTQIGFSYTALADGTTRIAQIVQTVEGGDRITSLAYDLANCSTTVTDPLGNNTVYSYDGSGRLIGLQAPTSGTTYSYDTNGRLSIQHDSSIASHKISYGYDADGNLVSQTDALGNTVSYQYDDNGNLTLQRDAAGNTVTRTYGSRNELLTETVYATPDPDGAGAGQPVQPQTTRYAYDSNNHLRFVVTPEGRVTEYRYNAQGQRIVSLNYTGELYDVSALTENAPLAEDALANWVGNTAVDKSRVMRTDTTYDFRGQVSTVTSYANTDANGVGVADGTQSTTRYVYDQAGRLLQKIAPKEASDVIAADNVTSYAYDGMGRLLTTTDALGNITLNQYDDAANTIKTILANGLASTSTYNRAGELISVLQADGAQALGETNYVYDSAGRLRIIQDPVGVKHHILYDEAGRKVAEIDGTRNLTEYVYNIANQVVATIRRGRTLTAYEYDSLTDSDGNPTDVTLADISWSTPLDRITWNLYDTAGRLVKQIDGLGFVTETQYDGTSRPVATIHYANAIDVTGITVNTKATDAAVTPTADSTQDRRTRIFYDKDGNIRGALDAGGYLTENQYDAAGRLIHAITYARQTDSAHWTAGTLEQLRPAENAAQDLHQWTLYDGNGKVVGQVDSEGYLTETLYDALGNQTRQTQYAGKVLIDPAAMTADTRLDSLRPAAQSQDRIISWTYTERNQIKTRTDAEGTVTRYSYDSLGNLIRTERALGTDDVRTQQLRYDKQGRLIGELSAEGSVALTALTAPTAAQIDALWAQYGITHTYDAAGHKISTTDQNGHKTRYYYDGDGQLAYQINALGEVTRHVYNDLDQLTQTIRYATRLNGATMATLQGGLVDGTITNAVASLANAALDSKVSLIYDNRGQIVQKSDELGNISTTNYNAFGEVRTTTKSIDATHTVTTQYDVNRRGLVTQVTEDLGGLNRITRSLYDAFGRVIQTIDARGQSSLVSHDRLGRIVQTTDALGIQRSTSYDAFSRVLTQMDGNGHTTTIAYDQAARSTTVTSAEGIQFVTTRNRHGQTVQVRDGRGNATSYNYDKNGNLKSQTEDALGLAESKRYDNANQLIESTDANGIKTAYSYDAANRLLSRTVDPDGLALTTTYDYDAKGQTVSVTDPNHVVTQTSYDLKGQAVAVTIDPAGLNLRTTYTYDGQGRTLTVTEGAGSAQPRVTQYSYDAFGRRIHEVIDPAGLNLATHYVYDSNDNLIRKTDAAGNVTRYVYDADNRLVYTVDPLGGVVERRYDAEGHVVSAIRYAHPIVGMLPVEPALADVAALLTPSATDQSARTVYDPDGRAVYQIDALGYVTQTARDANGNIVAVTQYAQPIALPATLTEASVGTAVAAVASDADRLTRHVYDAANRLVYGISATGTVTENIYDGSGNLIETIAYASAMSVSGLPSVAGMQALVAAHADATQDHHTRYVLDRANRVRYTIDALGCVQQHDYDAVGHVTRNVRYADPVAVSGHPSLADIATLLPANLPASAVVEQQTWDAADRLIDTVDGEGFITRRTYDAASRLTDITQAYGTTSASRTHRTYDAAGRVVAETKGYGTYEAITTRYGYDVNGNVLAIVDPRGVELAESDSAWALAQRRSLGYLDLATGNGKLAASLTAAEQQALLAMYTTRNEYDAAGHKTRTVDALGGVTQTFYDTFGNVVKVIDPRGGAGYFYYDKLNHSTLYVDPEGFVTESTYDGFGEKTAVKIIANRAVGTWNENMAPVRVSAVAGSGPYVLLDASRDQLTSYDYDRLGHQVRMTDALRNYETYGYDAFGNRTAFRNKLGGNYSYSYDRRGLLVTETLPVTTRTSGGSGISVTNQYSYDAFGNRIRSIEAAGAAEQRSTDYVFDKLNRQTAKKNAPVNVYVNGTWQQNVVTVEAQSYDARGNMISRTDANGNRTVWYYDALNRKIGEVGPTGTLSTWTYDSANNAVVQRVYGDPVNLPAGLALPIPLNAGNVRETQFTYDANNRETQSRVGNLVLGRQNDATGVYEIGAAFGLDSVVISKEYDAAGNLVKQIDGNGGITYFFYDKVGQKILQVDAEGYGIAWTHDANGNVTVERKFAKIYPGTVTSASSAKSLIANWPTDAGDRITQYVYDRCNRLSWENLVKVAYATTNVASGALSEGNGTATTYYNWNALGQKTSEIGADVSRKDWTYDLAGRLTGVLLPSFVDFEGNTVRATTNYEYDGLNHIKRQISRGKNNASEADDQIDSFTYDAAGRLTSRTDALGNVSNFAYDAAGNMTFEWSNRVDADGNTIIDGTVHGYDGANRETRRQTTWQSATQPWQFGTLQETRYNAFGEVTGKRTNGGNAAGDWQEFAEYNALGKVAKTNFDTGIAKAYLYDANGNATLSIESAGADLRALDIDAILPRTDVFHTVTVFDKRNQVTAVIQPKMDGTREVGDVQQFSSQQVRWYSGGSAMTSNVGVIASTSSSGSATAPAPTLAQRYQSVASSVGFHALEEPIWDENGYHRKVTGTSIDSVNVSFSAANIGAMMGAFSYIRVRVDYDFSGSTAYSGSREVVTYDRNATSLALNIGAQTGLGNVNFQYRVSIYYGYNMGNVGEQMVASNLYSGALAYTTTEYVQTAGENGYTSTAVETQHVAAAGSFNVSFNTTDLGQFASVVPSAAYSALHDTATTTVASSSVSWHVNYDNVYNFNGESGWTSYASHDVLDGVTVSIPMANLSKAFGNWNLARVVVDYNLYGDGGSYASSAYADTSNVAATSIYVPINATVGAGNRSLSYTFSVFYYNATSGQWIRVAAGSAGGTMTWVTSQQVYTGSDENGPHYRTDYMTNVNQGANFATAVYTETTNRTFFSGGDLLSNPNSEVWLYYRTASSQPYTGIVLPKATTYLGTGSGETVRGVYYLNNSSVPSNISDYKLLVMDNGSVAGTFNGTGWGGTDGLSTAGRTGVGEVFFEAGGIMSFYDQDAASLVIQYRPTGSNAAWTQVGVGKQRERWFRWDWQGAGLSGAYDMRVLRRDGSDNITSRLFTQVNLTPTPTASALNPYAESKIQISGQPATASKVLLKYRAAGSTGDYTSVWMTSAGSGSFSWDASNANLLPIANPDSAYTYEYEYEAFDSGDQLVNEAYGTFRVTPKNIDAGAFTQTSKRQPTVVSFYPEQANALRMDLSYRPKGSTGAYTALATMTRANNSSAFTWDASAVTPQVGSADYEYIYTLSDADGQPVLNALGEAFSVNGVITVGEINSSVPETGWVILGTVSTSTAIKREQHYNAFGEVIAEIDGRGNETDYGYNTAGKLILKQDPTTDITGANGVTVRGRPETRYYYDLGGNAIGTQDANGNRTVQRLIQATKDSSVATEYQADGGQVVRKYDVFGNLRVVTDAVGRVTRKTYNKDNQLIRVDHAVRGSTDYLAGQAAWDTYEYDSAGNRIAHSSALGRERSYFDSQGRVVRFTSMEGRSSTYAYTYSGAITGAGGQAVGGWQKVTTEVGGMVSIENKDIFDRMTWRQDFGGHQFNYTYNDAGWLTAQTSSTGQSIGYEYYANGYLKSQTDYIYKLRSDYTYDANGNRVSESYRRTDDPSAVYALSEVTYDELNRVTSASDPKYRISYRYDAVGNRRSVKSYFSNGVDGAETLQEFWYTYDAMNRFTTTMGQLSNGAIVLGTTGKQISYNLASERVYAEYVADGGVRTRERYTYTADGQLQDTFISTWNGTDWSAEYAGARRNNDLGGRVIEYFEYQPDGGTVASTARTFDADNRQLTEVDRMQVYNGNYLTNTYVYNADGTLYQIQTTNVATRQWHTYTYEWWDSAKQTEIKVQASNDAYAAARDNWAPGASNLKYDLNGNLYRATDVTGRRTMYYVTDANGQILQRHELVARSGMSSDWNDLDNVAVGGTTARSRNYYYINGARIGDTGNTGDPASQVDYAEALSRHGSVSNDVANKKFAPTAYANFDENYQPINDLYPGNSPTEYTVQAGDQLRTIAAKMWGDSSLWYLIADANGLAGGEKLVEGTRLVIPNKVTNLHNNASTFKVYEPGEAIGDTSPTLPEPPPMPKRNSGCGGLGKLIVVIVAVVATVLTAGALSEVAYTGLAGLWTAGTTALAGGIVGAGIGAAGSLGLMGFAAAGAIGSIVSQGIGIAIGAQDSFSWKQVAMAGVGSVVGGGINLGPTMGLAKGGVAATMVNSAAGNAISQGVAVAVGAQNSFSWKAVAASAVGAGVGHAVADVAGTAFGSSFSKLGPDILTRTTAGFASAAASQAIMGGKADYGYMFADSFVSGATYAIGNAAAASTSPDDPLGDFIAQNKAKWDAIPVDVGNALGASLGEQLGQDRQQYSELEQAQDFARENARFDTAYKERVAQLIGGPGYSEAGYFDSYGKTAADRYAETFGEGDAINTSNRLHLSSASRNGTELGRLQAREFELISQNRQLRDEIEWNQQQATLAQSAAYAENENDRLLARYPAPADVSNGATGEARAIGTLEAFFTFDKPGQILKGVGLGFKAPVDMVIGAGNLASDAYGFTASALTGEPYQAQSGLMQSIQSQGLVATAGDLFANTVKSLPGIAQVNSLYRNDMVGLGQSLPGLMGTAGGLKVFAGEGFGANKAVFSSEEKLLSHFDDHGAEFRVNGPQEYLQVGRDIMQSGQKIEYLYPKTGEIRTGYVSYMRNSQASGESLFGFVGTNLEGDITTIHTKSRTELFRMIGDDAQNKLKVFRTDTIGPNPQNGWKFPYSQ